MDKNNALSTQEVADMLKVSKKLSFPSGRGTKKISKQEALTSVTNRGEYRTAGAILLYNRLEHRKTLERV